MRTPKIAEAKSEPLLGLWFTAYRCQPRLVAFADMEFPARKARLVIGKGRACDLSVEGDYLSSSEHFELTADARGIWINDLNSTNGTCINDVPVHKPMRLRDKMVITFGLSEAVAVSLELKLPVTVSSYDSLLYESYKRHGSSRAASKAIGRGRSTIQRAVRRRRDE